MDLSTSLSGAKGFRIVKRGYDPDEVDEFLEQIASGVGELKRKLAEAEDRAVQAPPPPATDAPSGPAGEEAEEIKRALILAQRAADEEVRKATEQGEALVAEARQRADAMRREAEEDVKRRREDGRAELLAELEDLERTRDAMANDVVLLERHVDEQREVVQAAIGELQTLIDHPEAFRIAVPTGMSSPPPVDRPLAPVRPPIDLTSDADDRSSSAVPAEAVAAAVEEVAGPVDAGPGAEPDADGPPAAGQTTPDAAPSAPNAGAGPAGWIPPPPPPEATGVSEPLTGPAGGDEDEPDAGPPTEAHDTLAEAPEGDESEDAFLAELRKAMLDEEPLGPRDEVADGGGHDADFGSRARPRFGRRR